MIAENFWADHSPGSIPPIAAMVFDQSMYVYRVIFIDHLILVLCKSTFLSTTSSTREIGLTLEEGATSEESNKPCMHSAAMPSYILASVV